MNTLFFDIRDPENSKDAVRQAAELLQKGEVVAMPTETVYGLAANAFDREAVAKIFVAKGRPQDNPLIVHIADVNDLYLLASEVPETALKLAEKFWPGPLTVILPKKERVPDVVSGGLPTVAVRMPSHKGANALIRAAGVPLAAPSANISGFPSPTEMRHVADDMQGRIAAVCDGGNCEFGVESTVISLATEVPTLLRPGSITKEQLESVLGEVLVDNAVLHPLKEGETVSSPGMKYRHYAPKAKITIVRGDANAFRAFMKEEDHKTDFALCFEEDVPFMPKNYVTFGSENDPLSQTNRLFEALRELDERGAERVWAREPSTEGVGLAVCNRLYRAAGFQFVTRRAYVIGVTGATGAGKSTLCRYFKESGYAIVDADEVARSVTAPGSPVLDALSQAFGEEILQANGRLDRKKLAAIAFMSPEKTALLNSITHPEILKTIRKQTHNYLAKDKNVVLDVPLLFECGLDAMCDYTIHVTADREVRKERLRKRDKISDEAIERRMDAQHGDEYFSQRATFEVCNNPDNDLFTQFVTVLNLIYTRGGSVYKKRCSFIGDRKVPKNRMKSFENLIRDIAYNKGCKDFHSAMQGGLDISAFKMVDWIRFTDDDRSIMFYHTLFDKDGEDIEIFERISRLERGDRYMTPHRAIAKRMKGAMMKSDYIVVNTNRKESRELLETLAEKYKVELLYF